MKLFVYWSICLLDYYLNSLLTRFLKSINNSIMRIISIIQDQIINGFLKDLELSNLSKNSIRFYKSDVLDFSSWLISQIRSTGAFVECLKDTIPFLKKSHTFSYKIYLIQNKTAVKTINRMLSTLTKFYEFLSREGIISFDLCRDLENIPISLKPSNLIPNIINNFEKFLLLEKASRNTIKNYLADVRHFLNWIESKHATA